LLQHLLDLNHLLFYKTMQIWLPLEYQIIHSAPLLYSIHLILSEHLLGGLLPHILFHLLLNPYILFLCEFISHLSIGRILDHNEHIITGGSHQRSCQNLTEQIPKTQAHCRHQKVVDESKHWIEQKPEIHGNCRPEVLKLRFEAANEASSACRI